MIDWGSIISIISGTLTVVSLVSIFLKLGREKGTNETVQKEMRKDIDQNAMDINKLGQKVNSMEIENTKLISTLSSDLGWIKSSLSDIKSEISKKEQRHD
jgi:predicted RNase H-like nuclease (RuvC/YqgF family)